MKTKTLIFLRPFDIENPTPDEQLDFIMQEAFTFVEYDKLGNVYNNAVLYGKDLRELMAQQIKELHPEWIVAEGKCASVAMSFRRQKRILINPRVTFNDLNNVSEFTRKNTFGFFDKGHEKEYERFQTVYPNAIFYPTNKSISLLSVKDLVDPILDDPELYN